MPKGVCVKELNRMIIRTQDNNRYNVYAPRDKELLQGNVTLSEAEEFCQKTTRYIAYPLSKRSRDYLSQYVALTDSIILAIGKHAMRYALHGDVCAYYTDLEDFFSDWTSIGYTRTEARELLHGGKGEFFKLPDNLGYIRFAV